MFKLKECQDNLTWQFVQLSMLNNVKMCIIAQISVIYQALKYAI